MKKILIGLLATASAICLTFALSGCGKEKHPHELTAYEAHAATCLEGGNKAYWHCEECDIYFSDSEGKKEIELSDTKIKALGHKEVIDKAVEPDCTHSGRTEGKHCSVCNEVLLESQYVPQKHSYAQDVCTLCGKHKPSEGLEYWQYEETAAVGNVGSCEDSEIYIDDEIGGKPVTEIAKWAFFDCRTVTSVHIPASVTNISPNAFGNCFALAQFVVDENNPKYKSVDGNLYSKDGTELVLYAAAQPAASYTIPAGVKTIAEGAFSYCSHLTSVTIPQSVTTIGEDAFSYCHALTIYCEAKERQQGWNWFWNNSGCPVVWNCKENDLAEDGYIYATIDGLRYALKDGTATVERQSYDHTEVTIPASVTYKNVVYSVTGLASSAFYGCDRLKSVVIPDSVNGIQSQAFYECINLTSVTIGKGVTYIGSSAFYSCSSVSSVSYTGNLKGWCELVGLDNLFQPVAENCKIYIDGAQLAGKITIPDGTTKIESYTFNRCKTITGVIVPDSVKSIGFAAFFGCNVLTSVSVGNGVESIGESAFANCRSLSDVTLGNSVKRIGENAFNGCCSLTIIVIPNGVTRLEYGTFGDCNMLASVSFGNGMTMISRFAFYSCTALKKIYYKGTTEEFEKISVLDHNDSFTSATKYYYSETNPFEGENAVSSGNYWHYGANHTITIWSKS